MHGLHSDGSRLGGVHAEIKSEPLPIKIPGIPMGNRGFSIFII
jgi:hypothetical protein